MKPTVLVLLYKLISTLLLVTDYDVLAHTIDTQGGGISNKLHAHNRGKELNDVVGWTVERHFQLLWSQWKEKYYPTPLPQTASGWERWEEEVISPKILVILFEILVSSGCFAKSIYLSSQ